MNRPKSNAQIEREALEGFVVEKFELHKGRYGYRRINRELRRDGIVVSEKRVLAVMRRLGLQAKGTTRKHRRAKTVEKGDPRASLITASSARTPGTGSGPAASPISTPTEAGPASRPRQARGIARSSDGRCRAGSRRSWP